MTCRHFDHLNHSVSIFTALYLDGVTESQPESFTEQFHRTHSPQHNAEFPIYLNTCFWTYFNLCVQRFCPNLQFTRNIYCTVEYIHTVSKCVSMGAADEQHLLTHTHSWRLHSAFKHNFLQEMQFC